VKRNEATPTNARYSGLENHSAVGTPTHSLAPPRYSAITFLAGTYIFSWAIWLGLLVSLHFGLVSRESVGSAYAFGGVGPSLMALVLTWRTDGLSGTFRLLKRVFEWRAPLKWYAFALCLPVFLRVVALALYGAAGGRLIPVSVHVGVLLIFVAGLIVPMMEEYGWRGYLQPALSRRWTPAFAGVLVGLAWAVWHFPLFGIPATGLFRWAELSGLPLVMLGYTASVVALALLFSIQFYRTNGNLWLAFLLHDSVNTSADVFFAPYARSGAVGPTWWFVLVVLIAGVVAACLLRRTSPASANGDFSRTETKGT
jgi:uncharacterized protein